MNTLKRLKSDYRHVFRDFESRHYEHENTNIKSVAYIAKNMFIAFMEDFSEKIKKIKFLSGVGFQKFFPKMFRKTGVAPQLRNHQSKSKLKSFIYYHPPSIPNPFHLCIEKEHKD